MKNHRNQRPNMLYYSKYKWNRRLPRLMNKEYIALYGIAPDNGKLEIDVNTIKQRYKQKPFQLFSDDRYLNKKGRLVQQKADRSTTEMSPLYQPICLIIKRNNLRVLNTTDLAEDISKNDSINNQQAELNFYFEYCRQNNFDLFYFAPVYEQIRKNLKTMRLKQPQSHFIYNTDIIIDTAIGIDNINKLVKKYSNMNKQRVNKIDTPNTNLFNRFKKTEK